MTDCPYIIHTDYEDFCQCTSMMCDENDEFEECKVYKEMSKE